MISPTEEFHSTYTDAVTPGNLFFESSDNAYALRQTETSALISGEVNATFESANYGFFFGPKIYRYSSALRTDVYDEQDDYDGLDDDIDTVDISSTNTLVGAHLGISGMYDLNDWVSIGGRAAIGLYTNFSALDRSYSDHGSGYSAFATSSVSSSSNTTGFAQSLELSPKVDVALTNNLDLTMGATFLYLNGVDEPGQHYEGIGGDNGLGTLAADTPSTKNGVGFSGLSLGLKGRF